MYIPLVLISGDPVFCGGCHAALSATSSVLAKAVCVPSNPNNYIGYKKSLCPEIVVTHSAYSGCMLQFQAYKEGLAKAKADCKLIYVFLFLFIYYFH